jgi:hypothetical protein
VEAFELGPVEAPFSEVPGLLVGELDLIDAPLEGDHAAEGGGMVGTDAVEVDAENEVRHGRGVRPRH